MKISALTKNLNESFQSMYDAMAEQYDSIDSTIAEHKKSIKTLNQMKKDIEADMVILEQMGIGSTEIVEGDESNVENQEEES